MFSEPGVEVEVAVDLVVAIDLVVAVLLEEEGLLCLLGSKTGLLDRLAGPLEVSMKKGLQSQYCKYYNTKTPKKLLYMHSSTSLY